MLDAPEVIEGRVLTSTLEAFPFTPTTVDVLEPGGETTVQDLPGRLGYWEVGVPPSGPFDDRSFALGNRRLGNDPGAPGLECVAGGPTLRFRTAARGLHHRCAPPTSASTARRCRGPRPSWCPRAACCGSVRRTDQGCARTSSCGGGFDVPRYLDSAATFTLGEFGGHGGRPLRAGDVLHLAPRRTPRPRPTEKPEATEPA